MTDEWYEIAWINFTKAILHGCKGEGHEIELVLNDAEREAVYAINDRHAAEMKKLLASIVEYRAANQEQHQ